MKTAARAAGLGTTIFDEMSALVAGRGFTEVTVRPLSGDITVPGDADIPHQHLLTARRK